MLETGGHISIEQVPDRVIKVVDVKCPGSGESDRNDWSNLARLQPTDEVKFVIKDRTDYEWAREFVRSGSGGARCAVLFSPSWQQLDPRELAEWLLADRLDVRLQVQLHKYLWGAERGR